MSAPSMLATRRQSAMPSIRPAPEGAFVKKLEVRTPRPNVFGAFVTVPLGRLMDAPLLPAMVAGTTFAQVGSRLLADPFATLLLILLSANGFDWLYGRRAADLRDEYDDTKSKIGLHGKIGAVLIVLLVRALEWWGGARADFLDTDGTLACILAFALVLEDANSIQRKREELGLGPIPLLSPLLGFLGGALGRLVPAPPRGPAPTSE